MTSVAIFSISGIAIILLVVTKILAEKKRGCYFVLRLISKGDTHIRRIYHRVIHFYSESREEVLFVIYKQLPIYAKKSLYKLVTYLKNKREQYFNSMRNSKLLKKPDGLSEFFKNMSNIEKGNGEIHDSYENDTKENNKT